MANGKSRMMAPNAGEDVRESGGADCPCGKGDYGVDYIQCDDCSGFFHLDCVHNQAKT